MPLPTTGSISLGQVNTELEIGSTSPVSLNQSTVRNLFGRLGGSIDLESGRGKSYRFYLNRTISSNINNYNLKQEAINAGWDQIKPLTANIVINNGVVVSSVSTGTAAFDTGVGFPGNSSISISNFGAINGLGGAGGVGGVDSGSGGSGLSGGLALRVQHAVILNNTGIIAGGSGGQGGGAASRTGGTSGTRSPGCSTGSLNCFASNSTQCSIGFCNTGSIGATGARGGSGGANGVTGATGVSRTFGTSISCTQSCPGLGCSGIVVCPTGSPGAGGAPGLCIAGNSNINYSAFGTRLGPIN